MLVIVFCVKFIFEDFSFWMKRDSALIPELPFVHTIISSAF